VWAIGRSERVQRHINVAAHHPPATPAPRTTTGVA
jgi:hypothetical protein